MNKQRNMRNKTSFQQTLWILLTFLIGCIVAKIEFKNLKCTANDPEYLEFDMCILKAVNRTFGYLTVKAKLLRTPLENITVGIKVMKKANGYKPFLYDISFDACQFMKNRRNPLISYFYSFIKDDSNMNHPCPYKDDIYVEKLSNNKFENVLRKLPMPLGEYGIITTFGFYNKLSATVELYASLL